MSTRYGLSVSCVGLLMLLAGCSMGSLFIHEQRSPYDFDATVAKVVENAHARGWIVPQTFDFQKSLVAHHQRDPGRMKVIKLCSPELASRMFAHDDSKFVSVMAPCSISVYEKSDGRTYLAAMDMALMSKLMGGEVGPVLAEIADEDAAIIGFASVDR
ncbi:DUF302 domain-containing protein [Thiocapsa sp. UBA6158]|uniref:DUF302 domain-containing protein n=1 Tax=Thiocapsa sp. UBA6158 TaxID=1947692 RepID=UPI0025CD9875|nr:DUF302 domain-containing protein [Thiocapsa sp. UBA6158]